MVDIRPNPRSKTEATHIDPQSQRWLPKLRVTLVGGATIRIVIVGVYFVVSLSIEITMF